MGLQHADGPHVVDALLDGVLQGTGLAVAVADYHHFLSGHDGADTDGEGLLGHLVDVVVEEAAVGNDGVGGEGLDTGLAGERRAGLVEGDVAVGTDATHEEVDTAGGFNHALVAGTLGHKVGGIAVEDMDILGIDIDVVEEVVPHEGVVALGMVLGKADILVHVEGDDVLEGYLTLFVQADKFLVHAEWRRACGATQHEGVGGGGVLLIDFLYYVIGCPT